MSAFDKIARLIGKDKEPQGHCEAMTNRHINSCKVVNREIKKALAKVLPNEE